ncbi:hypothetical protein [Pseudomonas sp. B7]|jgi:hypothetical protein|uniref:hypothetical protein n=1 Tax=Pseudomonas sp. B7 TaxID=360962 RepID=UPI00191D27AB|nr:hypothetical protein [Pseudomonas sp. B7]MBL0796077.1 hypothetical protein [Pseudomonas sp. B7]
MSDSCIVAHRGDRFFSPDKRSVLFKPVLRSSEKARDDDNCYVPEEALHLPIYFQEDITDAIKIEASGAGLQPQVKV